MTRTRQYRRWMQRTRSRALNRLTREHPEEWRRILAEEQAADPWTPGDARPH